MRSCNLTRFSVVAFVALASALVLAAPAPAADGCSSLSGVITGWIADGAEGPAWYGVTYLSFDGAPHVLADLVDLNDGYSRFRVRNKGSIGFAGNEILTFRLADGSFQVKTQFSAACGPEGFSCELHETGALVPETGTGRFAGMTGNVSIQGPFAGGTCGPDQPCLWIADVTGAVCAK